MLGLEHFSFPLRSLKNGRFRQEYAVDSEFFSHFEKSPITTGVFAVQLEILRSRETLDVQLEVSGSFDTTCDRCTAPISLPYSFTAESFMKISDEPDEEDIEAYHIPSNALKVDVSKVIYDVICLHMPMIHTYNCENDNPKPCDMKTLERLDDVDFEDSNSPWDALKDLKLN